MTAQRLAKTFLIATTLLTSTANIAFAQISDQIAYSVEVNDPTAMVGKIVSQTDGKYALSTKEYDSGVYGVIVNDPAVSLNKISSTTKYVVINGQANVQVSKKNGNIKEGDLITTSKDLGL